MNLSYNWLKTFVDLEDLSIDKLSEELTLAGLEVEGVEYLAKADHLVVGKVIDVKDHPNADTLKVCNVNIGEEILQIVCGAPNVAVDQKVIVAKVGADLNGFKIKESVIRDVESNGMICSLSELGVNKKSLTDEQLEGIEVLGSDAKVGDTQVLEYLNLDDVLFDIDLTPNRSDCLSMFNMAREIGAVLNRDVKLPIINDNSGGVSSTFKVESLSKNSLQVLAKAIGSVTVKPSVPWMANILRSQGMQPINNVVDISNIVMLETGQPLHFYDIDKLPAKELIVKDGYSGKYKALDDVEYDLSKEDLLITSNDEIIGIAGIMGGSNSMISESTTSLLIEAAHFDLARIRISSRNLNISSEAASRFSKGIDPNAIFDATNRAVDLLVEYADATLIEESIVYGERNLNKKRIVTTSDYINKRLGIELTSTEITRVFERLNFEPVEIDNTIVSHVPTYRLDIESEVDLSEEVIRIIGVDTLPSTMPYVLMSPAKVSQKDDQKQLLLTGLLGSGFNEVISYSLVSDRHLKHGVMPIGDPVELSNPISNDKKYYRTSLFASMLDIISYNEARSNFEYSLFEIANVYNDKNESQERLIVANSNKVEISPWENIVKIESFFSIKGRLESILQKLGINNNRMNLKLNSEHSQSFHPYQSAEVYIDNKLFGTIGKTHPNIDKEYNIKPAFIGEFNLNVLYESKKSKIKYVEIPKYPGIQRDIAIIVQEDIPSEDIIKTILSAGKPLVKSAEVFDVYLGSNIEEHHKSVAIRIFYQSLSETLKDKDVNVVHEQIIEALISKHNVIYRKK